MVTAYPVHKKKKSIDICESFIDPIGGAAAYSGELREGPAFFYGVDDSNKHFWEAAKKRGDFYYCDNSYFDSARQEYFRVTKNRLQHSGMGASDCERFDSLGIQIQPWRSKGKHIVVCPQSDYFMRVIAGYQGSWISDVQHKLGEVTPRPLRLRLWSPDKTKLSSTLNEDLVGAHCLVTYSSAAAVSAILSGVPALCSYEHCAAAPMSIGCIENIEEPYHYQTRREWAGILADNQWTLDEMRSGLCWEMLQSNPR